MGSTPHTHFPRGAWVLVFFRNGDRMVNIYHSRGRDYVQFETCRERIADIRAITYYKPKSEADKALKKPKGA